MKKFFLQYVSDLHLEYADKIPNIVAKQKYLALLGDIGNPRTKKYQNFLKDTSSKFDKIFLISGNHEYWNLHEHEIKLNKNEIDCIIYETVSKYNNIIYLNNATVNIDNVQIVGSTLWSNIPQDKLEDAKYRMGDCNNIYNNNEKIIPEQINELHNECVNYIEKIVNENNDKKVVVLSHHCPSYQYLTEKYKHSNINYAFASNLDYLIKEPICAWLSGHTHGIINKKINGVICSINCQGYSKQNLIDYDPGKYIEI